MIDDDVQVEAPAPAPPPSIGNGKGKPKKAGSTRKATKKAAGKPKAAKPPKAAQPVKPASKAAKPAKAKIKAKARQRDPAKLDGFGYRLGTIRAKAAAMYAAKSGATLAEVKHKVGSIQFNVLTELKDRGFKIRKEQEPNKTGRTVTRFYVQAR